jgi:hypothetical protein
MDMQTTEATYLKGFVELVVKLKSARSKDNNVEEQNTLMEQIKQHIGSLEKLVDMLQWFESKHGVPQKSDTKDAIEFVSIARRTRGGPGIYPALWIEGFAKKDCLFDLRNWIEKDKPQSKQVPWDVKNPDYMQGSEAIVLYTKSKCSLTKLSNNLKPNGTIHYMRKPGSGCRVHIGDFRLWAEKEYPILPDRKRQEIADEILLEREQTRGEIDKDKNYLRLAKKIAGDGK